MIETIYNIVGFIFSLIWSFWTNLFLIPCFLAWKTYRSVFDKLVENQQIFSFELLRKIHSFYKNIIQWMKNVLHIQSRSSTAQAFLRYSQSEQNIHETMQRAAACPDDITENEKVMMLIQKMRRLEQTIFQQSIDRRRAEGQLFQLKIKLQQKNSELIKQRSQCIENLNKINFLKLELHEKNQEIQKFKKTMDQLSSERKKYGSIADQKIQSVYNESIDSSYLLIKEVPHHSESQTEEIQKVQTKESLIVKNENQREQVNKLQLKSE